MDPQQMLFAETHEWVAIEEQGDSKVATIGVSQFAVEQLDGVVYVELPRVGEQVAAGASFGEVESVKAVSNLYCPVDGEVVEVNESLKDSPALMSDDPYGQGWVAKVKLSSDAALGKLLDKAAYDKQCGESQ
ncbi:MAG: glycine cleavage system protein GcvH [Planctomycetales bacterium]|nr:glycine cleavage system protein GcvH [Planctomycetales bacterium]